MSPLLRACACGELWYVVLLLLKTVAQLHLQGFGSGEAGWGIEAACMETAQRTDRRYKAKKMFSLTALIPQAVGWLSLPVVLSWVQFKALLVFILLLSDV